MLAIDKTL